MRRVRDSSALASRAIPAAALYGWRGRRFAIPRAATGMGAAVAIGLLLFAAVWLSHLSFSSLAAPVDDIEQLTWVRSLEWGYYKHPPLPTWLLWLPVKLFGLSAWAAYVTGAAMTLGSMAILWRLLVSLRGPTYAGVALLAALSITYYNGRLPYYNHNVALLLFSTASAALCWRAFSSRQLRWWIALGLALGLGALSKYQVAVTIAAVLVFALHQRAWRDPELRSGLWVTGLVALLVFAPHLVWLRAHGFAPIDYAVESSLGARIDPVARVAASLHWLADQLFNRALPAILLLAWVAISAGRVSPAPHGAPARANRAGAARALLLSWGLVPLVFMPFVGVFVGADLQLQWGTPFLLFVVPATMELARPATWAKVDLRKALMAFLVIQGLLLALSFLTSPRGPRALQAQHWRNFDARLYAERIAPAARRELGGLIPVVIGPSSYAGALALALPEHPLVLIDARYDRSPWVKPDLVSRCGAVELGAMTDLADGRAVGAEFPGLAWRVVRPAAGANPCPN